MRRLLLLRHAKSSWADARLRDHERPLSSRGREAAPRVGQYLLDEGLVPDLVLCSSARRTCETLARLGLPATVPVEVTHDLYLASADEVLDLTRDCDDAVATLLVVGHNPTTQELAHALAGKANDEDALRELARHYPTGALACLAFTGDWRSLGNGTACLERFVSPRSLD